MHTIGAQDCDRDNTPPLPVSVSLDRKERGPLYQQNGSQGTLAVCLHILVANFSKYYGRRGTGVSWVYYL